MSPMLYCLLRHEAKFECVQRLTRGQSLIGRSETSDIWLPNANISRRHARISLGENAATIQDLLSRNGTFVNGTRLSETMPLNEGDAIQIANYSLVVFYSFTAAMKAIANLEVSTNTNAVAPEVYDHSAGYLPALTPAQQRVFDGLISGLQEKEVAVLLGISIHTVHTHSKSIYRAFGISSRAELLRRWAMQRSVNGKQGTHSGD